MPIASSGRAGLQGHLRKRFVRLAALLLATFAVPVTVPCAGAQPLPANGVGSPFELAFWQSVEGSNDLALYEAYLARYPNGTFAEIAHARIQTLRARLIQAVPPPASPQPVAPALPPAPALPAQAAATPVAAPAVTPPSAPVATEPASTIPVAPPVATAAATPLPTPEPVHPPTTAAAATPPAATTLGQLLAALAGSQGSGPDAGPARPANPDLVTGNAAVTHPARQSLSAGFALPASPAMVPVPSVTLPASFCSAEARNAFHDSVYDPAVKAARENNEAAVAHMKDLQALYDQYERSHDPDTMNEVAAAAHAYQPTAENAFSVQAALVHQFAMLMAVPLVPCAPPPK